MQPPLDVKLVFWTLQRSCETYYAGGCVRDYKLGLQPKDYDITTAATPEQVKYILRDVVRSLIDTGIEHGTVTAVTHEFRHVEITTFRVDGNYEDGRRPTSVAFTASAIEDVKRRDFTINALLHDGELVIDHVGGLEDLRSKCIRAVGNPRERFEEDGLRILRGIQFMCRFGFEIHWGTRKAMQLNSSRLQNISAERKRDELCKILLSKRPDLGIRTMAQLDVLQYVVPELIPCIGFDQHNPHHREDVFEHTLEVLRHTPPTLSIRLAALFHDISKPDTFELDTKGVGHFYSHYEKSSEITDTRMRELKFDNKLREDVVFLVRHHQQDLQTLDDKRCVKRFLRRVGERQVHDLIELMQADRIAHVPPHDLTPFTRCRDLIKEILEEKMPLSVNSLDINGHDLIKLGLKPGPLFKDVLNRLLHAVIEGEVENSKEQLLNAVHAYSAVKTAE